MALRLRVTARLLHDAFHGRMDGDVPEWPPSPFRLYQALVAGAARCSPEAALSTTNALRWLERMGPPEIMAPLGECDAGYRISVPNNAMDKVATAWSRGNANSDDAKPATHRAMKRVRPVWLRHGTDVHYLWQVRDNDESRTHAAVLASLARNLACLGWGQDLATGEASLTSAADREALTGIRWIPTGEAQAEVNLRVPVEGSLSDLRRRHEQFLQRIDDMGLVPPTPVSAFARQSYQRADTPLRPMTAAFALLRPDAEGYRTFHTARQGLRVAGMMRHTVAFAATTAGWTSERVGSVVLGHGEKRQEPHVPVPGARLAFVPLPSIESRGHARESVGAVRRVLVGVTGPADSQLMSWVRRALSGAVLENRGTGTIEALLSILPTSDPITRAYLGHAAEWSTVTPMILPGLDDPGGLRARLDDRNLDEYVAVRAARRARRGEDPASERQRLIARLDKRIDSLIRKAIVQAGIAEDDAKYADIDWNATGFRAGVLRIDHYGIPSHLRHFPRFHVRIGWRDAAGQPKSLAGPMCLGAGRFVGVGLFAPM